MDVTRAQTVSIRSVWPNEARAFTPWLAAHLDWLAEDLKLGKLTLEAMEVPIPGGRSLDLLATDIEGRAVAIENQYGMVNHDHLTRGLAYAVALQATDRPVSALIVIAEDHRDEFLAVAEYLNECAAARGEQGIAVFLVKVELHAIGDSDPAVRFTALAAPNEWQASVRRPSTSAGDAASFLAALPDQLRPVAQEIMDNWESVDGAWIEYKGNGAIFYVRNGRVRQGHTNPASMYSDRATMWLHPGRLGESLAFTEADLVNLEAMTVELMPPTTTSGGSGYYYAYPLAGVDPARVGRLLSWIRDTLLQA